MPYEGGLESHEHLKQQAADVQRRADRRAAERRQPVETEAHSQRRPWWAFWRRWGTNRETNPADSS